MRAPQYPQAWAWLALLGLASLITHQQTVVDAARPNNSIQKQKAKLHFVCKEADECFAWQVRRGRDGMMRMSNATECGVIRLKTSTLQKAQMKTLQSAYKTLGFYCKTISFLGASKKKRLRRQSNPRRGKFRGQTQSQYLNIGGHDNGKAEALSDADSSRALVSGKSGMGQAQSQSVYDPSCDECLGGGSDGAKNIRHSSGPKIALSNDGRFPKPDYSNVRVDSNTGRQSNPSYVTQQSPGMGPSSNDGKYGPPGGQTPSGIGPYQQPWSSQQHGGSIPPEISNFGIPNQGSFNTAIPSSNGQPDWRGESLTPTQQGNGLVSNQNIPRQTNIPGYNLRNPINGQIPNTRYDQIPSNVLMDRNGQTPNNGPIEGNGQVPNHWQVDRSGQIPNIGPIDGNGQIPNHRPLDTNGQILNNGPIDRNGQIPSNWQVDRNEQMPNNGPTGTNRQITNNGPTGTNGQIPNNGPIGSNRQITNIGPLDRNGQIGPIDRNGQIPSNWQVDRNEQLPNNGPIGRNGPVTNNGPLERNGQIPNNWQVDRNGQMDRNGQVYNIGSEARNGQLPNNGAMERNGQIPNNGQTKIDQNIANGFPEGSSKNQSQLNPDGSASSISTNPSSPNRFNQSPLLYPSQNYPSTNYPGNTGQVLFPGQMSSLPGLRGNGGHLSPLDNQKQPDTSIFPGQSLPAQGGFPIQNRNTLPIPYGRSTTSFIGPNGETYICCMVAPNPNGQEFGNKAHPNIGQPVESQLLQPGTQGQNNYPIHTSPERNSQYDSTGSQGSQNSLPGQDTVGLNDFNNQPTYGIKGKEAYFPSISSGGSSQSSPYGDQTVPIDGSGSWGNPYHNNEGKNTYPPSDGNQGSLYPSSDRGQIVPATGSNPQGSPFYNDKQGTPYHTTGQLPVTQTVPALNERDQKPSNPFTNSGQQSLYNSRGQEPSGPSYYNSGQGHNTYPINNQNTRYDSQRKDQVTSPLGSETTHYNIGQDQNPLVGSQGPNVPHGTIPIVGSSQGGPYYNQAQSPAYNANGQESSYYPNGGQNPGPANNIPFMNSQGQIPSISPYGQDVRSSQDRQGYPYGSVNGVPPQGGIYSPGAQILPSQSSTGGATLDGAWNNGMPYETSSQNDNLGPGPAPGQTGSQQGGEGQTYPNTIGSPYPQGPQGAVAQAPTQEQASNGQYRPIPGDRNMQNPSPGSYVIGNRGQEIGTQGTGGLQGNIPGGPYDGVSNTLVPGNQKPGGNTNNMYPGAQTTGLNSQQVPYNSGMGPYKDLMGPGYNQTSLNGIPQNVNFDPNTIISEKDESEAQASITHDFNGTMAIASSKGGSEKGKANTQVQGAYTGTGSFSAQAQITDDDKGAESQVSGGKEGATSNALGKGKNNKSQANVQLGSETGSLQTQSQSEGKHLSTNSQVQGGVKGGMADAQARGPGSTSSQAQIGFTPYKDGDKAHEILKTPFVGVGSASAQSNGKTGQSQSQLQGTFKYGITYNGAAQSGASVDKDTVFENRLPYKKLDVFEGEKNIEVDTEIPLPLPKLDIDDNAPINDDNHEIDHPHAVHHKTDEHLKNTTPNSITRSFDSRVNSDKEKDYEYEPNREEISPDDYDNEGADPPEYYDEFPREQDTGTQHVNAANRRNIDVQQTTRGNTQRILLGNLQGQNAEIVQKSSEQAPDYRRIYQPGERVPGTGGYIIPAGFTGSIQALSSRDKTTALGSRESPSQAQTVSLTPGNGQINYITAKPAAHGKSVNPNQLKSLHNNKPDDNSYMTVSKSVSGALDEDNKIKKEYSHTYYTKSSSCGYFTFTCTMVRGTNGTRKVCKPKIPTNPDGTPVKC